MVDDESRQQRNGKSASLADARSEPAERDPRAKGDGCDERFEILGLDIRVDGK